jgi:hypothetical protein
MPPELSPWLIFAVAAAAMALLLMLVWPRRRGRGDAPPRNPPEPPASLEQQRAVERDIQSLVGELSEMARKVGAQLDARAARLETLIRAADERLERLRAVSESSNGRSEQPPSSATGRGADPSADAEMDPRHVQIYALLDEGLSANQIAERLGRPEGEVELIIALRPRTSRAAY